MHVDKNKNKVVCSRQSRQINNLETIWGKKVNLEKISLNNSIKAKRSHFGPLFVMPDSS